MADMIKVTVIATGFDRAEEEHQELMRQASRAPIEREVPPPAPSTRASQQHAPPQKSEPAQAYTARRPAAPAAPLQASTASAQSSAPPSPLPHVGERITFPSNMDADWDIPTYQRRNV